MIALSLPLLSVFLSLPFGAKKQSWIEGCFHLVQKISWALTDMETSVDMRCTVAIYILGQLVYEAV